MCFLIFGSHLSIIVCGNDDLWKTFKFLVPAPSIDTAHAKRSWRQIWVLNTKVFPQQEHKTGDRTDQTTNIRRLKGFVLPQYVCVCVCVCALTKTHTQDILNDYRSSTESAIINVSSSPNPVLLIYIRWPVSPRHHKTCKLLHLSESKTGAELT